MILLSLIYNMNIDDILKNVKAKKDDNMVDIDKRIVISTYKEKNKHKTQVKGLEDFMKEAEIEAFNKLIKTKMGCNGTIVTDNETKKKTIVFSGDHVDALKKFIVSSKITTIEFIR